MTDYQIGDQVTFNVQVVPCNLCGTDKPMLYPDTHYLDIAFGEFKGLVCRACNQVDGVKRFEVGVVRFNNEEEPLPEPRDGNFHPSTPVTVGETGRAREYWDHLAWDILETMVLWCGKVLKFNAASNRYKGIWIKPKWSGDLVVGFELAGDTPSKELELNPYQRSRLSKMGFREEGRTNKTWNIELQASEGDPVNATAILLHTLKQGYLLETTDLYAFNPTLDFDSTDPEYQHLRHKPQ